MPACGVVSGARLPRPRPHPRPRPAYPPHPSPLAPHPSPLAPRAPHQSLDEQTSLRSSAQAEVRQIAARPLVQHLLSGPVHLSGPARPRGSPSARLHPGSAPPRGSAQGRRLRTPRRRLRVEPRRHRRSRTGGGAWGASVPQRLGSSGCRISALSVPHQRLISASSVPHQCLSALSCLGVPRRQLCRPISRRQIS